MAGRLQIDGDDSVLLHITHSNLKTFSADVRFSLQSTMESVKEKLWRKCGTSVNCMSLELYDDNKSKICDLADDSRPLGFYSPLDGFRLHVIDLDPSSVTSGGWLEDTSLVKKYAISEEDYEKRTFRKFKDRLVSQNPSTFEPKITDNCMEDLCANIKYLDSDDYVVMVISTVVMTAVVPSIISSIYNPNKRLSNYKLRTIQNIRLGREFLILSCLQSSANALGTINLLDSSNASKGLPLCVFALHLVELTGRASASLIVHTPGTSSNRKTCNFSEQIVNLFETYSNLQDYVAAQPLTALSPFSTMHEDICSVAEDKHVSLLILPFHKLPTRDGKLEEEGSSSFRSVNLHVLNDAPCSVAIFVDRGYGATGESNSEREVRERKKFEVSYKDLMVLILVREVREIKKFKERG
ncbi:cation/H(+) antiporter 15-like isoform X2 [Euphorbia lathyris]|uniref:cation/H(+) antiporter 15-like isoform X2 n=1 Tax=Euphorbia lathyris TaxID=212925 RepID=UPI00331410B0